MLEKRSTRAYRPYQGISPLQHRSATSGSRSMLMDGIAPTRGNSVIARVVACHYAVQCIAPTDPPCASARITRPLCRALARQLCRHRSASALICSPLRGVTDVLAKRSFASSSRCEVVARFQLAAPRRRGPPHWRAERLSVSSMPHR